VRYLRRVGWIKLSVSPTRYVLLRRLKEVRIVQRDAHPDMVNDAQLARGYGFTELGRFAGGLPGSRWRRSVNRAPICPGNAIRRPVNFIKSA
jgi:hypothetical protein